MPRLDRLVNCARFVVIPSENVGEEFRFVVTPNKASDLTRKEEEEDPENDARVRVLQELAGDVKPFWEPDVVRKTVVEVSSEEVATRLRRIVVEERGLARVVKRSMSSMSNTGNMKIEDEVFSALSALCLNDSDFTVRGVRAESAIFLIISLMIVMFISHDIHEKVNVITRLSHLFRTRTQTLGMLIRMFSITGTDYSNRLSLYHVVLDFSSTRTCRNLCLVSSGIP